MVISFLVLWSICSTQIDFKNGPDYLLRGTAQVFIPLIIIIIIIIIDIICEFITQVLADGILQESAG